MADSEELARWLAEIRVDEAAAARARERWLRQQAGEEATLVGILLDLAERGTAVIVDVAGRRLRGRIDAVAEDFCALRDDRGTDHLIAYAGVSAVEPLGESAPTGHRPRALDLFLREALAHLVADRPRVQVVDRLGDVRTGELVSVGQDVAVLRLDGRARRLVHLPVASIAEAALSPNR